MSTEYRNQTFFAWHDFDSGRVFKDLVFTQCTFQGCTMGIDGKNLSLMPTIRDVEVRSCEAIGCSLCATIVEDVIVDGLKTSDLLQTWATVFKHVTLKGRIDRLMFSNILHPGFPTCSFQEVIALSQAEYYASVDWAIDISEADFKDFDCRGVPSRLVRRDPQTQMMVTRKRVAAAGQQIAAGGPVWEGVLKLFLKSAYPDRILIAPKRNRRKFKELAVGLNELRRHGIVEPD